MSLRMTSPVITTVQHTTVVIILRPFMQVRRWCRIVFGGGLRRGAKELSANQRITEAEAMEAAAFLSELGL